MSSIEWTEETWNPVIGCTKVSEGCRNCYAERMSARLASMHDADVAKGRNPGRKENYVEVVQYGLDKNGFAVALPHWNNDVVCIDDALTIPYHWRKPRMIFVNSMSDLFHPDVPFEFIDDVFAVMALCPRHTFQILTKRTLRMVEYLSSRISNGRPTDNISHCMERLLNYECGIAEHSWPLPNVWLGTSVENQETADERIPHLLGCPASIRFLSCEPLLGPIDLSGWLPVDDPDARDGCLIDWIIVGGESGPGARPCNIEWIRNIVNQCNDAGVPCFVKQLGAKPVSTFDEWNDGIRTNGLRIGDDLMQWKLNSRKGKDPDEWPADLRVREMPEVKS